MRKIDPLESWMRGPNVTATAKLLKVSSRDGTFIVIMITNTLGTNVRRMRWCWWGRILERDEIFEYTLVNDGVTHPVFIVCTGYG